MGGKLIPTAVFLTTLLGVVACSGSNSSDDSDPGTQMPSQTASNAQGWQMIDMIADQAETKLDSLGHFDTSRNACGHEAYGILDLSLWNNIVDESNQAMSSAPLSTDHLNCFDIPEGNRMDGTVDFVLDTPAPVTHSDDLVADVHASPAPTHPTSTPTSTPTPRPTATPTSTPTTHPSASPSPSPSPSDKPKRSIYEMRGGQICTTIPDTQLAKTLLKNISTFVDLANKQDCANGYGN
jgi:cell division septation protein DedD